VFGSIFSLEVDETVPGGTPAIGSGGDDDGRAVHTRQLVQQSMRPTNISPPDLAANSRSSSSVAYDEVRRAVDDSKKVVL
jgi:hypothetical protein